MSKFTTLLLSFVLTLVAAASAQAATLATFSITGGTYGVVDGNTFTINGNYSGDATGLAEADPFEPLPLVFGATLDVNGTNVFAGNTGVFGPLPASPNELFMGALFVQSVLNGVVDVSTGETLVDYVAGGEDRVDDGSQEFDFGVANLFFSFTGGTAGPTLSGSFTATFTGNPSSEGGPSLSELINGGLADLSLLGVSLAGFIFPSNDTGTFVASFQIATVPLPAGLPLFGVGLLGMALLRRRRPT